MSQPYEFFGGAGADGPLGAPPPFGAPSPSGAPQRAVTTTAPAPAAQARPGAVPLLAGLLVVQAALVAVPGMTLLLVRDVVHRVLGEVMSAAGAYGGLGDASFSGASAPTAKLTLWGLTLVLVAAAASVGAVGTLGGHAWGWLTALAAQVVLLLVVVAHLGDYHVVGGLGLLTVVASGGLLASAPVRRWCGPA